jgi:hypothetical protein
MRSGRRTKVSLQAEPRAKSAIAARSNPAERRFVTIVWGALERWAAKSPLEWNQHRLASERHCKSLFIRDPS